MESTASETLRVSVAGELTNERQESIETGLAGVPGVQAALVSQSSIEVVFEPQICSRRMLEAYMQDLGIVPVIPSRRPGLVVRFIERMIRSNRRTFGSRLPDCCHLPEGELEKRRATYHAAANARSEHLKE